MRFAMGVLAVLCVALGCFPGLLYGLLPYPVDYQLYTASHLSSQFLLLLFAGLVFLVLRPALRSVPGITLDFDWFYRVPLKGLALAAERVLVAGRAAAATALFDLLDRLPSPERLAPVAAPAGAMLLVLVAVLVAALLLA
jgi:multicomponent Na+:H+ antiporter subunit D